MVGKTKKKKADAVYHIKVRIAALILAVLMLVTSLPMDTYAAVNLGDYFTKGKTDYDENLLNEMTALYEGDETKAKEVLNTLYANGLIDETGNVNFGDTFEVTQEDGTITCTKDELRALAEQKDAQAEVAIDGVSMTWGEIHQMFTTLDAVELLRECEESEVKLTTEHITALKSLSEQLSTQGLSVSSDGNGITALSLQGEAGGSQRAGDSFGTMVPLYFNRSGTSGNYTYTVNTTHTTAVQIATYDLDTDAGAYVFKDSQVSYESAKSCYKVEFYVDNNSFLYGAAATATVTGEALTGGEAGKTKYTVTLDKKMSYDVELDIQILDGSYEWAGIASVNGGSVDTGTKEATLVLAAGEMRAEFAVSDNKDSTIRWGNDNGVVKTTRVYVVSVHSDYVNVIKEPGDKGSSSTSFICAVEDNAINKQIVDAAVTRKYYYGGTSVNNYTLELEGSEGFDYTGTGFSDDQHFFKRNGKSEVYLAYSLAKLKSEGLYDYQNLRLGYETVETKSSGTELKADVYFSKGKFVDPVNESAIWPEYEPYYNDSSRSNQGYYFSLYNVPKATLDAADYIVIKLSELGTRTLISCKATESYVVISEATPTITPTLSIPDGVYYPGDVIPIVMDMGASFLNFNAAYDQGYRVSITANNKKLIVQEKNGMHRKLTFLYEVQETDQLTVNVTGINGTYFDDPKNVDLNKDKRPVTITGNPVTVNLSGFNGYYNKNASLNTPDKRLTFKTVDSDGDGRLDSPNTAFARQADGSYRMDMDVSDNPTYYAWLAANAAQDKAGNWYVKGMYASNNGGQTRLPVYVKVDFEEFSYTDPLTGDTVRASEKPVGIYVEFIPEPNTTEHYQLVALELFLDPDIASSIDYINTPEESAAPMIGGEWSFGYTVEPAVLLAQEDIEIRYDYNETWMSFVPEGNGADDYMAQAFDYQIAKAQKDLILAYDIVGTKEYSYAGADNFRWSSSEETIATVATKKVSYTYNGENVQRLLAVITPTGGEGEVEFTLTATNGNEERYGVAVTSAKFIIEAGNEPYLTVPGLSKETITLQNEPADIYFSSNIPRNNGKAADDEGNKTVTETEITLTVYPCNKKGEASGESIYRTNVTATATDPVTVIHIPENELDTISIKDGYSYRAEVSAADLASGETVSDYALIRVQAAPAKVVLNGGSNHYVLDNEDISISWEIKNINTLSEDKEWYYTVTRKSDNTVVDEGTYQNFNQADMSYDLDLDGDLSLPDGTLKEIYNISICATNDKEADGYSVDSMLLYVYNADALDVVVRASNSAAISADGDQVALDNTAFIESLKSDADSSQLNLGERTLQELSQDVNLSSIVSINYGAYAWGLLSDQIKWKVSKESTSDAALNYEQGGGYSDIETGLMPTYLPTSNFMLTASTDGEFSLTATHAKTGMVSEVTGTVKNLKDQLYLFQSNPAVKTQVTYKNKAGQDVVLYTDDTGGIAIYEPEGIAGDVYFRAEVDGDTYMATRTRTELRSSEKNVALLQVYPVNQVRLNKASEAVIYLSKPNGTPLANAKVIVRGGVYVNGTYAKRADLYIKKGDVDAEAYSNGLYDQTFTTNGAGALTVYFDMDQFTNEGDIALSSSSMIGYIFELRFVNDSNQQIYKPEVFELSDVAAAKGAQQITLLANDNKNYAHLPFAKNRVLYQYQNGYKKFEMDMTYDSSTERIGASEKFDKVELKTLTYLWKSEVDRDPETHQSVLRGDLPPFSALYRNKETNEVLNGQEEEVIVYEFSSFPILKNIYTMDCGSYGGTKNGDTYSWKDAWIESEEEKSVDISFCTDGTQTEVWPVDYKIVNTLGKEEAVESVEMSEEATESVTEQLDFDIDKILGDLVPGGDILAKGMTFFSGLATGGDYTIGLTVVPTTDPTIYNMILSVGEYEAEEGDASLDYSDSLDFEKLQEEFGSFDDDDDDEDGDDNSDIEFSFSGSLICRATYSMSDSDWDISIVGGEVGGKVGVKKDYNQNFTILCVPVTVSISASASVGAKFGAKTQVMNGKEEASTLTSITVGAGIEAFVGVGFDYSVIALKIGIFGKVGFEVTQKILLKESSPKFQQGQMINIEGEVGIKFVAKLLFVKYEKTFASVGFGWDKSWNDYDAITNYWSGQTKDGRAYTATTFADGQTMFTLERISVEDRDYLNKYARVWTVDATAQAMGDEGWFKDLMTNAYPYADPIFSDDGNIIIYLSDDNSTDIEETVACWAKWSDAGNGYERQGAIAKLDDDTKESYGYGDTSLSLSGSNGTYVAAWVQQRETSALASQDTEDGASDSGDAGEREITNEDLAIVMRSTEIMAAVYEDGVWKATRLTENTSPDLAPAAASNDKGEAMVFWRSAYGTSTEDPLDFNVEDTIRYTRYTDGGWSGDSAIAYNGSNGPIKGIGAAMAPNGNGIVAYTVKTGEAEEATDFETFYSYIERKDGTSGIAGDTIETVRVTQNDAMDENIQVVSVTQQNEELFLLGWYTADQDGNSDIKLLAVREDGSLDTAFPESVRSIGNINPTNTFRFAVSRSGTLSGLAIAWVEKVTTEKEGEEVGISTLQAVKLYEYDGGLRFTGSQQMAEAGVGGTIDYFDVYTVGDTIHAVANITDYSAGNISLQGVINMKDLVEEEVGKEQDWETNGYDSKAAYDEAWQTAYQALNAQYNGDEIEIYSPDGESKLSSASYTFTEGIELVDTQYDSESVFAGAEVTVTYTLANTGITPMEEITILNGEDIVVQKGAGEGFVLLPGASTSIAAGYTMGSTIKDTPFTITTNLAGVKVSGEIEFNRPDIGIESMEVTREANGERDINVKLYNDSQIPLAGNDKSVVVNYYLDSSHTIPVADANGVVTTVISPDDADAMELIDNGAYITQLTVDVSEAIKELYGDGQAEIPESGITIYGKAALYNAYGTGEAYQIAEDFKSNNEKDVTFKSLTAKTDGEELSFRNTTITKDEETNELTVTMEISNSTMEAKSAGNVMVELLDEEGNVLASMQTFDVSNGGVAENAINLSAEGTERRDIVFDLTTVKDGDKAVSVNCYVCSTEAEVTFDLAGKATGIESKMVTLGETVSEPETTPASNSYKFEGWYADAEYLEAFDFGNTKITVNTTIYAKWKSYAPTITEHPKAIKTIYDGKEKSLTVKAECVSGEMTYQWYKDGKAITDAIDSTHTVLHAADSGTYYCKVTTEVEGVPFTIRSDVAKVEIRKRSLAITSGSESKRYDGIELKKNSYTITEGTLGYGDRLEVTIEAAIMQKGEVSNTITAAIIKRGEDEVTDNYELATFNGTLRITETELEEYAPLITAQPSGTNITYDAKARMLVVTAVCEYEMGYQWYKGGIPITGATGRTCEVTDVSDSGTYYCKLTAEINHERVTVDSAAVEVSIKKVSVSITANSKTMVHNGKKLKETGYSYIGTLADGHKLDVKISGSITKPGSVTNKIERVTIKDGNVDKIANYEVKTTNGKLTVTKGTSYQVKYAKNSKGTVTGMSPDINRYKYGKKAVALSAPSSQNRFFTGWNTKKDGSGKTYKAGAKLTVNTNMTLYAQWEKAYTDKKGLTYQVNSKKNTVTVTGTTKRNATSIKIPATIKYKGITYQVTEIKKNAFKGMAKLKTVTIGKNVTKIGEKAFYNCKKLRKVTIGKDVRDLGKNAFAGGKNSLTITVKGKAIAKPERFNIKGKKVTIKVPAAELEKYQQALKETGIKVKK